MAQGKPIILSQPPKREERRNPVETMLFVSIFWRFSYKSSKMVIKKKRHFRHVRQEGHGNALNEGLRPITTSGFDAKTRGPIGLSSRVGSL